LATQSGILWLWPGDVLGLETTTDTIPCESSAA
jgi:hypothetical protein